MGGRGFEVTMATLKKNKGCSTQVTKFKELFGESARVNLRNLRKAREAGLDVEWVTCLLQKPLRDKYDAAVKPLWDKYDAAVKPLQDKYDAARNSLWDKYLAARNSLWDKSLAAKKPLWDKYLAAKKPLWDKYLAAENRLIVEVMTEAGKD